MKALLALNPLIWKYRGRLFLGMVFVVFTNMFAVWAPSMIGEGVNALNEANTHFLVPMAQGQSPTLDQLELPRTLAFLADTLGWAWQGLDAPTSRETVLDFVLWVGACDPCIRHGGPFDKGDNRSRLTLRRLGGQQACLTRRLCAFNKASDDFRRYGCGRAMALVDHAVLAAQQFYIVRLNHGIAQLFSLAYCRARAALYSLPKSV